MRNDSVAFLDANVLVYAYDERAPEKRDIANELIDNLWTDGSCVVSTQVLQEFYAACRSKLGDFVSADEAASGAEFFATWPIHQNATHDVLDAIALHQREQLSFWDALIVVAAQRIGATVVYSEDLGDRAAIDGIEFVNPFAEFEAV